jgi:phenylacetate-CoA ligase
MHVAADGSGRAVTRGSLRQWLVPRVVLPLVGRIAGRRISARLADLRERQWWSAERLEADAVVRLRHLIEHARVHVPYYRQSLGDAGLRPEDIRSLADLSRVPVTTKATLRAAGLERTTADNVPARRRWPITTTGSSGAPLPFYADLAAEDTRVATYLLALEWAGVGVWDVEVKVGSPFRDVTWLYPRPTRVGRLGRRVLLGQRSARLEVPRPTHKDLERLVRETAGRRPWFLRGFPTVLALLGDGLLQAGDRLPTRPTSIISRGETLTVPRRATIAEAFRGPVVDHYASNEIPHLAQSCPGGPSGLHVLGDRAIVRVVREDGRPAAPGERGRVLVTDLENRVMPFINYAVGDLAVQGPPCACGRALPILEAVEGRELEVVRLPAGDRIPGYTLLACMREWCDMAALREFQIVQTATDRLLLKVVPTPRFSGVDSTRLKSGLESLLGPGMTVEVTTVDQISAEPSGKRLLVKTETPA